MSMQIRNWKWLCNEMAEQRKIVEEVKTHTGNTEIKSCLYKNQNEMCIRDSCCTDQFVVRAGLVHH